MNVCERFCFNRGKSLKQSEEICEIAFWQKIRKTGQAHFKSPGPHAPSDTQWDHLFAFEKHKHP
jgi:hypothetical protein